MSEETSLKLYLRQIDAVALLTEVQERELFHRLIRDDDPAARDALIRANLRLVVHIARHYTHRRGVSLLDIVEEGNVGLLKAVAGFNPDLHVRFSTYAAWWIQQAIRRALRNTVRLIHVPEYMLALIAQWHRTRAALQEALGRPPNLPELAAHLGLSLRQARIVDHAVSAFSLFSENEDDPAEGLTLAQKLCDRREPRPDRVVLERDEMQAIRTLFLSMDRREAQILRLRFGLDDNPPLTLRAIGQQVGLTRERVRQIEGEALAKLKACLDQVHGR